MTLKQSNLYNYISKTEEFISLDQSSKIVQKLNLN